MIPTCICTQVLDVSNNRLRRLPADIGWLGLKQLDVSGNPDLAFPCKAVLAKGLKAVLSYLQASALPVSCVFAWRLYEIDSTPWSSTTTTQRHVIM
jgi:hypothetical protein